MIMQKNCVTGVQIHLSANHFDVVYGMLSACVFPAVCFVLSVPVQEIAWKASSSK